MYAIAPRRGHARSLSIQYTSCMFYSVGELAVGEPFRVQQGQLQMQRPPHRRSLSLVRLSSYDCLAVSVIATSLTSLLSLKIPILKV